MVEINPTISIMSKCLNVNNLSVKRFIYLRFWPWWVVVAACRLFSSCDEWGRSDTVLRLLLLQSTGSSHLSFRRCSKCTLELRPCCFTQIQLLCGMCILPRAGIEPVSPALAGSLKKIQLQDQGSGLITQELLCSKVLLKYKRGQRKLLTQTSQGEWTAPHLLVLARELYIFYLVIIINQKNISRLQRSYQIHSHNLHFHVTLEFSCSVMSDSLQPHELQQSRPPCPSPTPEFTQTHVH